jgi:hypothetical protein
MRHYALCFATWLLVINSSSFAVASFDNLDKNQSYAKSSAWKI